MTSDKLGHVVGTTDKRVCLCEHTLLRSEAEQIYSRGLNISDELGEDRELILSRCP